MKIKPTADNIVIQIVQRAEKTDTGLILPETARDETNSGDVVAKGPNVTLPLEIGDHVILSPFGGSSLTLNGKEFLIVRQQHVLLVLTNKEEGKTAEGFDGG